MERQMYLEERVNGNSYYIRFADNPYIEATEALPNDSLMHNNLLASVLTQLASGDAGTAPSVSDYTTALQTFNNKEDVKVDIIIDSLGDYSYGIEVAKLCDREQGGRGDCYGALHTPFYLEESNNFVTDLVNYRKYTMNLVSSCVGLYTGHVKIQDNYNGRELWIPPTGFVASVFSYTADQYEPWLPAFGWRRGVLPVIDVYRRFSEGQRDVLYDNDINVIRFKPGKGIAVWGQKTMYGKATALDRANVRWLLIVIENAIEAYNEDNYIAELNTSRTRALCKNGIVAYLTNIKLREGLYDFDVVVDETNNTPQEIDNYIMNVDYYVQPTKAIEYIRGRAIITRTGVNFENVRITNT
jgi:hypothetical protein